MEGILHHDDGGFGDVLVLVREQARQLDGGLVGLGAGIAEEAQVHAGDVAQGAAEFFLQRHFIQDGGVHQGARLVGNGLGDHRVGVAESADGDAGGGVEVAAAVRIVEPDPFAAGKADRLPGIGRHERAGHRSTC